MSGLAIGSAMRFGRIVALSVWPPATSAARRSWRRAALMLLFLPLFALLQVCHWIGFAFDEVFFRGYRKVKVRGPVFVTGVPRSGTTMLHRTLSADEQYTTFSTWECLFAPSVTQRRVLLAIAALDRRLGAPLARAIRWFERRIFSGLEGVHDMSLADAEEDYFVFMPILRCFILVVPFPYAEWIWDMGRFDSALPEPERRRIMAYYHNCVRRHLYVHGTDKRFLSKNASFAPLLGGLAQEFSDARFVLCLRDPLEVVPSQLSALREGMTFFGNDPGDRGFRDRLIALLGYYYRQCIEPPVPSGDHQHVVMSQLKTDLSTTVTSLYEQLSLPLSAQFAAVLERQRESARAYRSPHRYRLDEFGLDEAQVRERFRHAYHHFDFQPATAAGAPQATAS